MGAGAEYRSARRGKQAPALFAPPTTKARVRSRSAPPEPGVKTWPPEGSKNWEPAPSIDPRGGEGKPLPRQ